MKKIIQEFKAFAMRGNVVDMAVGVIIGGAFGKIVSSLVADIIMPLIGVLIGGVNFKDLKWTFHSPSIGEGIPCTGGYRKLRQFYTSNVRFPDYCVFHIPFCETHQSLLS